MKRYRLGLLDVLFYYGWVPIASIGRAFFFNSDLLGLLEETIFFLCKVPIGFIGRTPYSFLKEKCLLGLLELYFFLMEKYVLGVLEESTFFFYKATYWVYWKKA